MADEIHVDDIGTNLVVTLSDGGTAVNLSSATTKQIILLAPDGTKLTKTATFVTDGTDGKIKYATIAGDLTQEGEWKLQAHVTMLTGEWRSDVQTFDVHPNL